MGSWVQSFNVIYFTFIGADMKVPPSFEHARTNGNFAPGTKIMYSIGGASYSERTNDWRQWFGSADSARKLASQVASTWKSDGIDIDLEQGAMDDATISANTVVFVAELRRLRPSFIITMAAYGYPQVYGESLLTVKSWNHLGESADLLDAVGLMVYSGSESLQWVG